MDAVTPWDRLLNLIHPFHPRRRRGRQPLGLEKLLRIYFLQRWFPLSDPVAEGEWYDTESMRRFTKIKLGEGKIPDKPTIPRFRRLLEMNGRAYGTFEEVKGLLEEKGLYLESGAVMDTTYVLAPSSATSIRNHYHSVSSAFTGSTLMAL